MMELKSVEQLVLLRESVDLECKLALGREGQGALPDDFWPTYSAFANTDGGLVVLGVRDKGDSFQIEGIPNVGKVRKELFDGLNNRQKSAPISSPTSTRRRSCFKADPSSWSRCIARRASNGPCTSRRIRSPATLTGG